MFALGKKENFQFAAPFFFNKYFFVKPKKSLFVALRYWEHALRQHVVISVIELLRNLSLCVCIFFMYMNTKKKLKK